MDSLVLRVTDVVAARPIWDATMRITRFHDSAVLVFEYSGCLLLVRHAMRIPGVKSVTRSLAAMQRASHELARVWVCAAARIRVRHGMSQRTRRTRLATPPAGVSTSGAASCNLTGELED